MPAHLGVGPQADILTGYLDQLMGVDRGLEKDLQGACPNTRVEVESFYG